MLFRSFPALYLLLSFQTVVSLSLDSIDTIFSFGDSYTSTGYDPSAGILAIGNTVTTSGGQGTAPAYRPFPTLAYLLLSSPAWIQLLAASTPARSSYFNLATSNSSIDSSIVSRSSGRDFKAQVEQFRRYFNSTEVEVQWDSGSTLFTVWFGADDIINSLLQSQDYLSLASSILTSYDAQIAALYSAGARHFLLIGLPSLARSPLATVNGAQTSIQAAVDYFSARIEFYVGMLADRFPGAEATYYSSSDLMDTVLDDPTSYGFLNTTSSCAGYAGVLNQPLLNLSSECGVALAQYFWRDDFHPTWPIHQLFAEGIAQTLGSSTNGTNSTASSPTSTSSTSAMGSSFSLPSLTLNSSTSPTASSNTSRTPPSSPTAAAEATTLTGTFILSGSQIFIIGANNSSTSTSTIPLVVPTMNSSTETSSPFFTPSASSSLPSASSLPSPSSAEPSATAAPSSSSSTEEPQHTTTTAGRIRVGTNTSGAAGMRGWSGMVLGMALALAAGAGVQL